jgi:hypothetical protein
MLLPTGQRIRRSARSGSTSTPRRGRRRRSGQVQELLPGARRVARREPRDPGAAVAPRQLPARGLREAVRGRVVRPEHGAPRGPRADPRRDGAGPRRALRPTAAEGAHGRARRSTSRRRPRRIPRRRRRRSPARSSRPRGTTSPTSPTGSRTARHPAPAESTARSSRSSATPPRASSGMKGDAKDPQLAKLRPILSPIGGGVVSAAIRAVWGDEAVSRSSPRRRPRRSSTSRRRAARRSPPSSRPRRDRERRGMSGIAWSPIHHIDNHLVVLDAERRLYAGLAHDGITGTSSSPSASTTAARRTTLASVAASSCAAAPAGSSRVVLPPRGGEGVRGRPRPRLPRRGRRAALARPRQPGRCRRSRGGSSWLAQRSPSGRRRGPSSSSTTSCSS